MRSLSKKLAQTKRINTFLCGYQHGYLDAYRGVDSTSDIHPGHRFFIGYMQGRADFFAFGLPQKK